MTTRNTNVDEARSEGAVTLKHRWVFNALTLNRHGCYSHGSPFKHRLDTIGVRSSRAIFFPSHQSPNNCRQLLSGRYIRVVCRGFMKIIKMPIIIIYT